MEERLRNMKSASENTGRILFNSNTNEIQILGRDARLWVVKQDSLVPVALPSFPRGHVNTACYHALSDTYLLQIGPQIRKLS